MFRGVPRAVVVEHALVREGVSSELRIALFALEAVKANSAGACLGELSGGGEREAVLG